MTSLAADGLIDRVRVLGPRDDMARVYSALDITTLSSAFGEGCPNVLLEAMACGVPCVATDCGDSAAILGSTGGVVPTRNPDALAAAWERLISLGTDTRRSLGSRARDRVTRTYALPAIVSSYDALYGEFAGRKRWGGWRTRSVKVVGS